MTLYENLQNPKEKRGAGIATLLLSMALVAGAAGSASSAAPAGALRPAISPSRAALTAGGAATVSGLVTCTEGDPCDDGNTCTLNDICSVGVCAGQLPPAIRYCSTGGTIAIPSGPGSATPYPSTLAVVAGPSVCKVTVNFEGLTHTNPDDLDILLSGPTGQNAKIMSDVGGSQDVGGLSLFLDDSASQSIPDGGPLFSQDLGDPFGGGTFKPTDVNDGVDTFPAPAPVPSGGSALSVFNGTNPNGTWRLWVKDDKTLDAGSINKWCMRIRFVCTADAQCDDGDACTVDTCVKGACANTAPEPEPPEIQGLRIATNKTSVSWSAVSSAIHYDVVRGVLSAFPVGSVGSSESCFNNVSAASLSDATVPPAGTGFWYLVRGENCYGSGEYGTQSNGFPQMTNTCPY